MDIESILKRKGREVRTIGPASTVAETLHRMRRERIGALVVIVGADAAPFSGPSGRRRREGP